MSPMDGARRANAVLDRDEVDSVLSGKFYSRTNDSDRRRSSSRVRPKAGGALQVICISMSEGPRAARRDGRKLKGGVSRRPTAAPHPFALARSISTPCPRALNEADRGTNGRALQRCKTPQDRCRATLSGGVSASPPSAEPWGRGRVRHRGCPPGQLDLGVSLLFSQARPKQLDLPRRTTSSRSVGTRSKPKTLGLPSAGGPNRTRARPTR
jgi:hypothetical protein